MRRRLLPAPLIATCTIVLMAAGTACAGVTNFYRFTYQDSTSATNAARYQLMDLGYGASATSQAGVRSLIASIHHSEPQTRILLYKITGASASDPTDIKGCATWNPALPYGGVPSSWFLRGANGAPLYNSTYGYYELDPGNPQVQQSCLASAASMAKSSGYDGVFWDMVSTSLAWAGLSASNCGSTSCSSDANWHAAIASFVTQVSAGLHAQGLLSIGNISGGAVTYGAGGPAYWQAFQLDGLDGAQEESFTSGTNHLPVAFPQWQQGLANEQWSEAHGKYFLANADVSSSQALNTYGLATLLLGAQGRSSWSTADGVYGSGEYWFPEYDTALTLGLPLGAYTAQADGLYVRRFQNGTVIVNPTTGTVNAGAYGNLGAQSGLIAAGPARYAGANQGAASTTLPVAKRSRPPAPRPRRAHQRSAAPKLSGLSYAGRRTPGVELFARETAFFGARIRDPNRGHRLTYSWNWGDGTAGCVAIPGWACGARRMAHTYHRAGRYRVTLTVADSAGPRVTGRISIIIHPRPPRAVFTAVRGLGDSIVTIPRPRGAVTSALLLPSAATSVVASITIAACGDRRPCATAAGQELLGRVVRRDVGPGGLVLVVRAIRRPLLRAIRILHRTPSRLLSATFAVRVKLADGKTLRIMQHVSLRL